jgi:hypothetical protein
VSSQPLSWNVGRIAARVLAIGFPIAVAITVSPLSTKLNASATGRLASVYIIGLLALAGMVAFSVSFAALGYLPDADRSVWRRRFWTYPLIAPVWMFLSRAAYRAISHSRDPA